VISAISILGNRALARTRFAIDNRALDALTCP